MFNLLWGYIKTKNLNHPVNDSLIVLDLPLCKALYTTKDSLESGDSVEKKELALKYETKAFTLNVNN